MVNKKAEGPIGMSFSMIFSIILIIFFLIVAFIAIKSFLSTKDCAQVGIFINDFQTEVDNAWASQKNRYEFSTVLPTDVEYICFGDFSKPLTGPHKDIGEDLSVYEGTNDNMFFYPRTSACEMSTKKILHINLVEMISTENPYCIAVTGGRFKANIEKVFNKNLVKVSRLS